MKKNIKNIALATAFAGALAVTSTGCASNADVTDYSGRITNSVNSVSPVTDTTTRTTRVNTANDINNTNRVVRPDGSFYNNATNNYTGLNNRVVPLDGTNYNRTVANRTDINDIGLNRTARTNVNTRGYHVVNRSAYNGINGMNDINNTARYAANNINNTTRHAANNVNNAANYAAHRMTNTVNRVLPHSNTNRLNTTVDGRITTPTTTLSNAPAPNYNPTLTNTHSPIAHTNPATTNHNINIKIEQPAGYRSTVTGTGVNNANVTQTTNRANVANKTNTTPTNTHNAENTTNHTTETNKAVIDKIKQNNVESNIANRITNNVNSVARRTTTDNVVRNTNHSAKITNDIAKTVIPVTRTKEIISSSDVITKKPHIEHIQANNTQHRNNTARGSINNTNLSSSNAKTTTNNVMLLNR